MSRRAFLNVAMIVFTLASSLGESLHALPGFAHDDEPVCQVRTDHMEAPAEAPHDDCPVCQSVAPFQAITPVVAGGLTVEVSGAMSPGVAVFFVSGPFESLSARGPPLA